MLGIVKRWSGVFFETYIMRISYLNQNRAPLRLLRYSRDAIRYLALFGLWIRRRAVPTTRQFRREYPLPEDVPTDIQEPVYEAYSLDPKAFSEIRTRAGIHVPASR